MIKQTSCHQDTLQVKSPLSCKKRRITCSLPQTLLHPFAMQAFLIFVYLEQPHRPLRAKPSKTPKPTLVFWILGKREVIYSLTINETKLTLLKRVQTIYVNFG